MADWLTWTGWLFLPVFLALDFVVHARRYAAPRAWRWRAVAVTAGAFWLSLQVGEAWVRLLPEATLLDLSGLGPWWGGLVGILVYELFHYGYHRAAHEWGWLWRASHRMHHAAESLDAFGAWYLHPLDVVAFTTIGTLVGFPLLGLSPEAGALMGAFLAFNAMFQHANLRTPRWLGWFVQRPESHAVHHARGVHAFNYSDLPLWDVVFGTYKNPARFDGAVGFEPGDSGRLGALLLGRPLPSETRRTARRAGRAREAAPTSA